MGRKVGRKEGRKGGRKGRKEGRKQLLYKGRNEGKNVNIENLMEDEKCFEENEIQGTSKYSELLRREKKKTEGRKETSGEEEMRKDTSGLEKKENE